MPADYEAVADELYGLPPDQFVAGRDARAAEARQSGDRPQAAAIKGLRRPTAGAWLANWLTRERGDELRRLLDLGAALRSAQDRLVGEELRQLSRQRHQVIATLTAEARRGAGEAGVAVNETAVRDLESTLAAALADDGAAGALRGGRLTTALHHAGFGPLDHPAPSPVTPAPAPAVQVPDHEEETARHGRVEAAEHALRGAEAAAASARQEAAERERVLARTRAHDEELQQLIQDLAAQLDALRANEATAAEAVRQAEEAKTKADRARRATEDEEDAARALLDQARRAP